MHSKKSMGHQSKEASSSPTWLLRGSDGPGPNRRPASAVFCCCFLLVCGTIDHQQNKKEHKFFFGRFDNDDDISEDDLASLDSRCILDFVCESYFSHSVSCCANALFNIFIIIIMSLHVGQGDCQRLYLVRRGL